MPDALTGLRRGYAAALLVTLAFRFWLAAVFPLTGDEAYFMYWGVFPAAGFYDHPPMVGWLLALLLKFSAAEWVLRLPAILLAPLLSWVVLLLLRPIDPVLTFVSRNLEPYRGFHVFMRSLPELLARSPDAHVVIVGGDSVSYGAAPAGGGSWRRELLAELRGQLDMSRLHFVGRVPYRDYLRLLQVSAVHCYLTYPFVLSWSCIEAMAAGCHVVGSRTAPVTEFIEHGHNGSLVDFFDTAALSDALAQGLAQRAGVQAQRQRARETAVESSDFRRVALPQYRGLIERMLATSAV